MSLITHNGVFSAIRNPALKKNAISARLIFKARLIRKYVVVLPVNIIFGSSAYTKVNYKI